MRTADRKRWNKIKDRRESHEREKRKTSFVWIKWNATASLKLSVFHSTFFSFFFVFFVLKYANVLSNWYFNKGLSNDGILTLREFSFILDKNLTDLQGFSDLH